ncbi:MAG: hypothetical protein ACOVOR_01360 [Rhabdochlamydiaceae bacterium]
MGSVEFNVNKSWYLTAAVRDSKDSKVTYTHDKIKPKSSSQILDDLKPKIFEMITLGSQWLEKLAKNTDNPKIDFALGVCKHILPSIEGYKLVDGSFNFMKELSSLNLVHIFGQEISLLKTTNTLLKNAKIAFVFFGVTKTFPAVGIFFDHKYTRVCLATLGLVVAVESLGDRQEAAADEDDDFKCQYGQEKPVTSANSFGSNVLLENLNWYQFSAGFASFGKVIIAGVSFVQAVHLLGFNPLNQHTLFIVNKDRQLKIATAVCLLDLYAYLQKTVWHPELSSICA